MKEEITISQIIEYLESIDKYDIFTYIGDCDCSYELEVNNQSGYLIKEQDIEYLINKLKSTL